MNQPIELYELENSHGMRVRVISYGATLIGVDVPDRTGKVENVTLHLDTPEAYLAGHPCLGSVVGRYANRIGRGRFTLDGEEYVLAVNNGPNHLHGGNRGFDKYFWDGEEFQGENSVGVELRMHSPDGDEGYPGNMDVSVRYELTNDNELWLVYRATTDRPTVVNLTNHAYWNLRGCENPSEEVRPVENVMDHELRIFADAYLVPDENVLPTGEIAPVAGTMMDFTRTRKIGSLLEGAADGSAPAGAGYDHCFVLWKTGEAYRPEFPELKLAAEAYEETSGRRMTLFTTTPGVQLYTGNHLGGQGGSGYLWGRWSGFCLETQAFPDSPNRPEFPSTVLRPGETYTQTTVFRFS